MKNQNRYKTTNRAFSGGYSGVPHVVQESANWALCSPMAIKLLMDLLSQFKGSNNGDMCVALSVIGRKGWTRGQTISIAARELIHYGMIEMTRQGDLHKCSLYAVTWMPIHWCKDKLDVRETKLPSMLWKEKKPPFERPIKKSLAAKRPIAEPQSVLADDRDSAH